MLQANALRCVRDEHLLFDALSFSVQAGEWVQVEGANGAGKTSLLRILTGLSRPEQGEVLWQGENIRTCRELYQPALLYIGHVSGLHGALTPAENLHFYHGDTCSSQALWAALAANGLVGYEDIPVASLSAGQQRRVALSRLWLSTAPLWILDEPLTALDKTGVRLLLDKLAQHVRQGGMVVMTSHQDVTHIHAEIRKIAFSASGWH